VPKSEIKDDSTLPGFLTNISSDDLLVFLDCLDLSYRAAQQFDSRSGLKFLVQKVLGLERAANLYRQAGAAWAVKVSFYMFGSVKE